MSRSNLAAHPSALLEHCQEASTTDGYTVCPQKKLRNSVDKIHGETIVRQLTKLVASSFGLRSIQATVCYQNSQKYLKFPRNHSNNVHRCKFKQLIPFRADARFLLASARSCSYWCHSEISPSLMIQLCRVVTMIHRASQRLVCHSMRMQNLNLERRRKKESTLPTETPGRKLRSRRTKTPSRHAPDLRQSHRRPKPPNVTSNK